MKTFGLIIMLLAASVAAVGQEGAGLRGVVRVAGQPVAGATIIVTGPIDGDRQNTETRVTDERGNYYVGFAKGGNFTIKVSFESNGRRYESNIKEPIELKFAREISLDIDLYEVGFVRETVTVAANSEQPIEQVSKSVNKITGQEMRDRADITLVDSLRTIPGFRVQQSGGFGRVASIKTRGLRNQDTAILIDGIRFRDPSAISGDASSLISDITLTNVAEVEVLRGSGSSLYGTNSIGGTVDFQTPTARKGTHGQLSGAIGGLGMGRLRGNLSHGADRFGVSGGVSRTAFTKGIDGQDNAANTNFQGRVDFQPTSRTNVSGRIFLSDANVRLNSSPDTFGTLPANNRTVISAVPSVSFLSDRNDPDNIQRSDFFSGQISVAHSFNDKVSIGGYYQGLSTKRKNDNGVLGVGFQSASTSIFDGTINTGNAHVRWTPVAENTLTVGYEYERETFGNEGRTPSGTGDFFTNASQSSNTLYINDQVRLLEGKLQMSGGLRIQQFGLRRPNFSLNNAPYSSLVLDNPPTAYILDGSASYFVSRTGTKFRAHAGNGYRVPSLYERMGSFFTTFGMPRFVALGDPFLKPERTVAFDVGVEQNLANDRIRLSAEYFYTQLRDVIGFSNVAPNVGTTTRPSGGYINQKGGVARGGEFTAKFRPTTSTEIFSSYTFTNSDQLAPQVAGSGIYKTMGIPDHQFTLVATQRYKRFWATFDLLATSSYLAPIFSNTTFSTYVYRFNGNRRGDLTAGYTFPIKNEKMSLRLFGTIENVFNQEYYENGFRTAKANARAGVNFSF